MTKDFDVKQNESNGGYFCIFYVNGKKFYADISSTFGNKCMIFEYDENDKIDWPALYCGKADASKESMKHCIEDFIEREYGV